MNCGHDERWLAYRNPVDAQSDQYCVFCENERLAAIVDRLPKDEAGEPIAPGDVLYDGYKNGEIKVTGFDTRDGKLTCLIFRKGWDAICSGYYHDREAAEKARALMFSKAKGDEHES